MDDEIRDNEEMKMDNVESNDDTTKSADTEAVDDDAAAETSAPTKHSDYKPVNRFDASAVHHLSGMYQNWFLDYASYVILERAVPHIEDGLNPCSDAYSTR